MTLFNVPNTPPFTLILISSVTKDEQVTLKEGVLADELQKLAVTTLNLPKKTANVARCRAKDEAKAQGGTIKDEFTLIKGFR